MMVVRWGQGNRCKRRGRGSRKQAWIVKVISEAEPSGAVSLFRFKRRVGAVDFYFSSLTQLSTHCCCWCRDHVDDGRSYNNLMIMMLEHSSPQHIRPFQQTARMWNWPGFFIVCPERQRERRLKSQLLWSTDSLVVARCFSWTIVTELRHDFVGSLSFTVDWIIYTEIARVWWLFGALYSELSMVGVSVVFKALEFPEHEFNWNQLAKWRGQLKF